MTSSGWKRRARENLRASEVLTSPELLEELAVQSVQSLWNSATSRLYYALFEAVVGRFVERQPPLTPKDIHCPSERWQHDSVQSACMGTLKDRQLGIVFRLAMALRERADYDPTSPVSAGEFREIETKVKPELRKLGVIS